VSSLFFSGSATTKGGKGEIGLAREWGGNSSSLLEWKGVRPPSSPLKRTGGEKGEKTRYASTLPSSPKEGRNLK